MHFHINSLLKQEFWGEKHFQTSFNKHLAQLELLYIQRNCYTWDRFSNHCVVTCK